MFHLQCDHALPHKQDRNAERSLRSPCLVSIVRDYAQGMVRSAAQILRTKSQRQTEEFKSHADVELHRHCAMSASATKPSDLLKLQPPWCQLTRGSLGSISIGVLQESLGTSWRSSAPPCSRSFHILNVALT